MANILHSALTSTEIHEPKGADTAAIGKVYVADGAGSGNWRDTEAYAHGYVVFDTATPAYQHSITTSDTVLNPTFTMGSTRDFTGLSSPNARLRYDAAYDAEALITFDAAFQQTSGGGRDIQLVIAVNGTAQEGARSIVTASSSTWNTMATVWSQVLEQNDYIEVFVKGSASTTLDFAHMSLSITAVPVE